MLLTYLYVFEPDMINSQYHIKTTERNQCRALALALTFDATFSILHARSAYLHLVGSGAWRRPDCVLKWRACNTETDIVLVLNDVQYGVGIQKVHRTERM